MEENEHDKEMMTDNAKGREQNRTKGKARLGAADATLNLAWIESIKMRPIEQQMGVFLVEKHPF